MEAFRELVFEPARAVSPALAAAPLPIPIRFVKYYDKGSTDMGAHHIADALVRRNWDARAIYPREIRKVRDGILIFIKTSRIDHLLLARKLGNRTVLDVQDTVVFKRWIKNRWAFDSLLLKSRRQLADYGREGKLDRVIYHHCDERYRPNSAPRDRLRLGYLGLPRSYELWGSIPNVECVADDWFNAASRFNCHLSIRRPGREFLYKPNCKVSTAAICEANLITTRDVTTVELLGEDYPYYCEPTRASILAAIDKAQATLGTSEWDRGLERMRTVRALTSLDRVVSEYEALFRDLAAAPR